MDASWNVLADVLILLAAALTLGALAEQLRQSAMIGYIVAGTLVGPNVLGWVTSNQNVALIAELGVALLLFTIGLEFSFTRLRRLGRVALIGGTAQVLVTLAVAAILGLVFGLSTQAAVAVGAMLALSSTACVLRLLADAAALESLYGRNALGILLLQDVAVVPLVLVTAVFAQGQAPSAAIVTLAKTALIAVLLIGLFYFLFTYVAPKLLRLRRWSRNRELPILLTVVMAIGSALAAHAVDISPAMGAFVAGILLGQSPFAVQIRADVASIRTLCVTLFFASVGMLGDPAWALEHYDRVLIAVAAIIIGKTLITAVIVRSLGFTTAVAVATGLCLAQVGEFSFVLAEIARGTVIDQSTFRLIVTTTIITLLFTPFMTAAAPNLAIKLAARSRSQNKPSASPGTPGTPGTPSSPDTDTPPTHRDIVLIGFGPAGQQAAYALIPKHTERIAVIDLNPANVSVAESVGMAGLIGDATNRTFLEYARVDRARIVLITIPDPTAARTIVQHCKALAPNAVTIVRARYHVVRWELQMAGAVEVIDEEEHVGARLAAAARKHLANLQPSPPSNKPQ